MKEDCVTENRLARETSPYLLQHAHNPVDWYPWGDEAFARARAEDKPILLSVGYSACHWCHVMERESFENPEIAAIMNRHFVSVKVDREERPDVDQIYMQAVQSMTGHGGWPMTCFLTPEGEPFYGCTDYPPAARHGLLAALEEPARPADGPHHADDAGAWRGLRPGRRWLPPLLGGPALARPALRKDALRQRPARLALPARLARLRRPRVPARLGGDARLSPARDGGPGRRLLLCDRRPPRTRRQGAGRVERPRVPRVRGGRACARPRRLRRRRREERRVRAHHDALRRTPAPHVEGRRGEAQGLPRGLRDGRGGAGRAV